MLRPPKNLAPSRACPLVAVVRPERLADWERLCDREHAVLLRFDRQPSADELVASLDDACRQFAIDPGRIFFVGGTTAPEARRFSAWTEVSTPDAWETLERTKAPAMAPEQTTLSLAVLGLRSGRGKILATLCLSEADFGRADRSRVGIGRIEERAQRFTGVVVFEDVPPGEAAVLLFHDENDNGKLDTGLFGIPKEGYSASNNPKSRMGPPRWKDCRFRVTGATSVREISLVTRYL